MGQRTRDQRSREGEGLGKLDAAAPRIPQSLEKAGDKV